MRRIESMEDQLRSVVTYEFDDGRRIALDARAVAEYGAAVVLRGVGLGHLVPTGRVDVLQSGTKIGTVPATFDGLAVKSYSPLYDPRPGDFRREGNAWVADRSLGPGDLGAVDGFVWDEASPLTPQKRAT